MTKGRTIALIALLALVFSGVLFLVPRSIQFASILHDDPLRHNQEVPVYPNAQIVTQRTTICEAHMCNVKVVNGNAQGDDPFSQTPTGSTTLRQIHVDHSTTDSVNAVTNFYTGYFGSLTAFWLSGDCHDFDRPDGSFTTTLCYSKDNDNVVIAIRSEADHTFFVVEDYAGNF